MTPSVSGDRWSRLYRTWLVAGGTPRRASTSWTRRIWPAEKLDTLTAVRHCGPGMPRARAMAAFSVSEVRTTGSPTASAMWYAWAAVSV